MMCYSLNVQALSEVNLELLSSAAGMVMEILYFMSVHIQDCIYVFVMKCCCVVILNSVSKINFLYLHAKLKEKSFFR